MFILDLCGSSIIYSKLINKSTALISSVAGTLYVTRAGKMSRNVHRLIF